MPKCLDSFAARAHWTCSVFWSARRMDDAVEFLRFMRGPETSQRSVLSDSGADRAEAGTSDEGPSPSGQANVMGETDGVGTSECDPTTIFSEGRSVDSDFARCTSGMGGRVPFCPNVKLLRNAFFADADAERMDVGSGVEGLGGDGSSSSSSMRSGADDEGMGSFDTGISPRTRLSLRTFHISLNFSSSERSFVVGGTGRFGLCTGDCGVDGSSGLLVVCESAADVNVAVGLYTLWESRVSDRVREDAPTLGLLVKVRLRGVSEGASNEPRENDGDARWRMDWEKR